MVAGNVLVELTEFFGKWGFAGDNLDECLARAHLEFKEWCRVNRVNCSQPVFSTLRLHYGGFEFPFLAAKAWNSRCVSAWQADVVAAMCSDGLDAEQADTLSLLKSITYGIHAFYTGQEHGGRFLSQSEADIIKCAFYKSVKAFKKIAIRRNQAGFRLWPLKPKWHALAHIADDLSSGARENPRTFHCFRDEDVMGLVKKSGSQFMYCALAHPLEHDHEHVHHW